MGAISVVGYSKIQENKKANDITYSSIPSFIALAQHSKEQSGCGGELSTCPYPLKVQAV